jgi:hypothetical protein
LSPVIKALLIVAILILVGAQPAFAYIDPSAGGMLFQMLAVVFASLSAILLLFSRQIRMLIARVKRAVRGTRPAQSEPEYQDQATSSPIARQSGSAEEVASHQATNTDPSPDDR